MTSIYIGVMTGTSMDGVDLVAASFDPLHLHATLTIPFEPELRDELMALTLPDDNEIDRMGKADVTLAKLIGHGINELIEKNHLDRSQIKAIGSHGQTIRHRPEHGFTLQIGDPNIITEITKIPVISDFRRRDMAAGGQGASEMGRWPGRSVRGRLSSAAGESAAGAQPAVGRVPLRRS